MKSNRSVTAVVQPPTKVPSYRGFSSTSPQASAVMRANRREGGHAEELLRKALWQRGLRFRTHVQTLPGKPDLVFAAGRVVVFCDGDFWHGRRWPSLRRQLLKRANSEYWIAKIGYNRQRDTSQRRRLKSAGWRVIRLWESDVLSSLDACLLTIEAAVRA